MLYHTEEILALKKRKAYSSKHRARLLGVVTTNDIPPHIPRSKPYSMVIFPDAFIFPAYESDSALNELNHMLTWYKVLSLRLDNLNLR